MLEEFNVDQNTLVHAWQQQLPEFLDPGDSAEVLADESDPQGFRVHINAAGHQFYSRITSYNVCYTKLLRERIWQDDIVAPIHGPS